MRDRRATPKKHGTPTQRWRRQVPLAHAIADFASHRARLVMELDGGQHTQATDAARTTMIEREGYRVIRFWNNEVLTNPESVHTRLTEALAHLSPPSNSG